MNDVTGSIYYSTREKEAANNREVNQEEQDERREEQVISFSLDTGGQPVPK